MMSGAPPGANPTITRTGRVDRIARLLYATRPEVRPCLLRDAEIDDAEVSWGPTNGLLERADLVSDLSNDFIQIGSLPESGA